MEAHASSFARETRRLRRVKINWIVNRHRKHHAIYVSTKYYENFVETSKQYRVLNVAKNTKIPFIVTRWKLSKIGKEGIFWPRFCISERKRGEESVQSNKKLNTSINTTIISTDISTSNTKKERTRNINAHTHLYRYRSCWRNILLKIETINGFL